MKVKKNTYECVKEVIIDKEGIYGNFCTSREFYYNDIKFLGKKIISECFKKTKSNENKSKNKFSKN